MATERIGYRLLYDAAGCTLSGTDSLSMTIAIDEKRTVEVHIGLEPRYGFFQSTPKVNYYVAGQESLPLKIDLAVGNNAVNSELYSGHLLTEITALHAVDVTNTLSDALDSGAMPDEVYPLVSHEKDALERLASLACGYVGLRFNPQFVSRRIVEHPLIVRTNGMTPVILSIMDLTTVLPLTVVPNARTVVDAELVHISSLTAEDRDRLATILGWIRRAWVELDDFSRFMALFIPLEVLVNTKAPARKNSLHAFASSVRQLIRKHSGSEKAQLLKQFNDIISARRDSLTTKFQALAESWALPNWTRDVQAFRSFAESRNDLVHGGTTTARLRVQVDGLRNLVERYVSFALWGDDEIHRSRPVVPEARQIIFAVRFTPHPETDP